MTRIHRITVVACVAIGVTIAACTGASSPHAQSSTPPAAAPGVAAQGAIADSLYPHHPGVDVLHYQFDLILRPPGTRFFGHADIRLRRRADVDTLRLDLLDMEVTRVTVAGQPREFRRDSAQIHIPLHATDGTTLRVAVDWSGSPSDGLIIRQDSVRGWSAFGDNWPNRGRHWLPLVDHPSDKATVGWNIEAPATLSVVANGVLSSSTRSRQDANALVWRFAMRQPIPTYLMVLGAARMEETSLGNTACGAGIDGACVPQSVWTFPQETSYAPGPFAQAGRMVEFFAGFGGAYPYERLAHVQSATRFGGMENATAIFYSDAAFRRRDVGLGLIAHETVHQWFGNAVTPRRWQDLWLSEGFASYMAPLYLQESQGDSVFRAQLRQMRATVLDAAVAAQRPVVDTVGAAEPLSLLNANSYQKGGWVLHMLRAHVGDSAFVRAVREYQRVYRHGTATTGNFLHIVERHAGRSLQPFAAQWLHRPGWVEAEVRTRWDASTSNLTLDVSQSTRFPPFAFPLTLLLRDGSGRAVRTTVQVTAVPSQTLSVRVEGIGQPVQIEADPDVALLGQVRIEQ